MKKLEDAPKELQDMFAELWKEITIRSTDTICTKDKAAHLFLKGFAVAIATNGMRPKCTIAEVYEIDGEIYVVSNDRKMFSWQGNQLGWYALPDLPQE